MLHLLARRLMIGVGLVFAVSALLFFSTALLPGDFATEMLGSQATPAAVEALRKSRGLDRPAPERYAEWVVGFVRGDMGRSYANGREIAPQIARRLGNTLTLALAAAAVAVPLAIGLGIVAAIRRNSGIDRGILVLAMASVAVPEFFVAYLLIALFAVYLRVLPSISIVNSRMTLWQMLPVLVLPAATLVLTATSHMIRLTRASLIDVLDSPYIETAVLKGLTQWRIVVRHALPNAMSPIVNVVTVNLADLIVGIVIVEAVFAYPGIGQLIVNSVAKRDIAMVQACGLIFAVTYIGLNLMADMLAIVLNPRLRRAR